VAVSEIGINPRFRHTRRTKCVPALGLDASCGTESRATHFTRTTYLARSRFPSAAMTPSRFSPTDPFAAVGSASPRDFRRQNIFWRVLTADYACPKREMRKRECFVRE
jgi:hypothetical protein